MIVLIFPIAITSYNDFTDKKTPCLKKINPINYFPCIILIILIIFPVFWKVSPIIENTDALQKRNISYERIILKEANKQPTDITRLLQNKPEILLTKKKYPCEISFIFHKKVSLKGLILKGTSQSENNYMAISQFLNAFEISYLDSQSQTFINLYTSDNNIFNYTIDPLKIEFSKEIKTKSIKITGKKTFDDDTPALNIKSCDFF